MAQRRDTFEGMSGAVAEVIEHDQVMTRFEQHHTGVAADEAGPSSDQ